MYHIKSDRRSRRTAEEISRGLLECLKEKPLNAVTISDIHRATGISRATFYRLFDNIDDVLEYLCALPSREEAMAAQNTDSLAQVFTRILELSLENHNLLKALVDNGRYDLLYRYTEHRFRLMKGLYPESLPELDEAAYSYTVSAMAMNMVAALATWIRRGRVDTLEEISRHTQQYIRIMVRLLEEAEESS